MRPLSQFQKNILDGKFNHPPAVIERFRTAYIAAGFDVPGQTPIEGEWKDGKWVFPVKVKGVSLAPGYDGLRVRIIGSTADYFEAK